LILEIREGGSTKIVYSLEREALSNPEWIRDARTATLDRAIGSKGRYGLLATDEWWENVKAKRVPLLNVSGRIIKAYRAGRDYLDNNTVDLISPNGDELTVGIYVNSRKDVSLFEQGNWLDMVYVLEELKHQPAKGGGVNYSKVALEVAITVPSPQLA